MREWKVTLKDTKYPALSYYVVFVCEGGGVQSAAAAGAAARKWHGGQLACPPLLMEDLKGEKLFVSDDYPETGDARSIEVDNM
jgi:hypothetical protein